MSVSEIQRSWVEASSEGASGGGSDADDVARWHRAEEIVLKEKLEVAKMKPPTLEEKIDKWNALSERQKKRKLVTRLRSSFRRPQRILNRLRVKGDDVIAAANEGLKPYRLERIIQAYGQVYEKLVEATDSAKELNDLYPDIAAIVGNFEWTEDVPKVTDEKGYLNILTSEGLRRARLDAAPSEAGEQK